MNHQETTASVPPLSSKPQTSGLAITSLITGLTCLAPAAIVCGHLALSRIKASAGRLGGRGLAVAGTILGYVGLVSYLMIIPTLFIGARAWKQGSDRAGCILIQRDIQEAVRAYQQENNLEAGTPLDVKAALATVPEATANMPCPAGGTITLSETIPPTGTPVARCSHAEAFGHEPTDHGSW